MKAGEPAGSAEAVAAARAIESARPAEDRLFHDPYARGFLTPGARAAVALCGMPVLGPALLAAFDRIAYGVRGFILARTILIDDALRAALERGVAQVLILGAGYDSRAYRATGIDRTRVFEVDHPATQARKRALLHGRTSRLPDHVRFVAVDFNRDRLGERLDAAGFQPRVSTFVIWEGVTEYLAAAAVDETLRFVAAATAPGSQIVFTYLDRRLLDGTKQFRGGMLQHAAHQRGNEPFTFGFDPPRLAAYLAERGLELCDDVAGEDFARRYFMPRGRLERANDHQRVALARVRGT